MTINLKQVRQERAITQTELAEKSGISRVTISKIESGAKKVVTSDTMLKLAKALGCSMADIFMP